MQSPAALQPPSTATIFKDSTKTTLYIVFATSFFSLLFILSLSSTTTTGGSFSSSTRRPDPFLFPTTRPFFPNEIPLDPTPPSIAYLISGSKGDSGRILRLLHAAYHPKNYYLLHLDLAAPQSDRDSLAVTVQSVPIFKAAQNVYVIGKADFAYPKGSSTISANLHGASILLRLHAKWDWFINLNAADYPLITQDDLLHILSYLPKELNFVNHSSYIGWRESKLLKPVIVDPGLYLKDQTDMFYATQKRPLPTAFRVYSGSTFAILSRKFVEFCILGADNFPRTLLMYLSNTPMSLSNYFPTILCNAHDYNKTVVNNNLMYVTFNKTAKEKPHPLNSSEFDSMIQSGSAFATEFQFDDPTLDRIDREILGRDPGKVVTGGWCLGDPDNGTKCSVWGDGNVLRPGPGAKRLEKLVLYLLSDDRFLSRQCI
ncbi:beta-glucuronosyltransferase GlcAT14A [Rutidosis leptorrhynchoides]|uniref:beta-glucuronosyltransferase GlcAT14A n=1 Tax=Rutidosis leptorrhynchoides TaxID=125765 RepID=UPI003A99EF7B